MAAFAVLPRSVAGTTNPERTTFGISSILFTMRGVVWSLLFTVVVVGCKKSDEPFDVCDPPDQARLAALPTELSQAGLYSDITTYTIGPGVLAFRPQFPLWSDGAEKHRWILLPAGAVIDTHDMDHWSLPQGTRIWKEFAHEGHRIETRVLAKIGPTDSEWAMQSYVWNADQTDATATPAGRENAYGDHDVPAAAKCMACHGGRPGHVLGFSAIQLAPPAEPGEIALADLVAQKLLSHPPTGSLDVPGDATTKAALGYLHANCSHCHNQARPPRGDGARCYDPQKSMDLTLAVAHLATPDDTPTYNTVIGHQIKRGDPDGSKVIQLVSSRGSDLHMPPLATEHVDDAAVANLRTWISKL
jgi:cytochrome c553